ncbi:MAG: DUF5804 family protein [Methanoregulaceae archaeon]
MDILFLSRTGVDLYHTLLSSETSRHVLRFYQPRKLPCGIQVTVASLGSALSLAGELKWYRQRYMREMLFHVSPGLYCTHALGKEIYYERDAVLDPEWGFRKLYGFREGRLRVITVMDAGIPTDEYRAESAGIADTFIEVWCMPEEMEKGLSPEQSEDPVPETGPEESGEIGIPPES